MYPVQKLRGIKNRLFNHFSRWSVAAYKSNDLWYLKKQTFWFTDLKKVLVGFKWCLLTKKCWISSSSASNSVQDLFLSFDPQPNTTVASKLLCCFECLEHLPMHTHPPPTHTCTHTLPEYPLGSFWIFIKETPTAATDRWAGVLTPGSGSLPIKTHRTKNIPPHWPRQQTFTSTKTRSLPASMSCPSCCSTQHSFKSIYMSCVINPISSGSSCSVKKKKKKKKREKSICLVLLENEYLYCIFLWLCICMWFVFIHMHVYFKSFSPSKTAWIRGSYAYCANLKIEVRAEFLLSYNTICCFIGTVPSSCLTEHLPSIQNYYLSHYLVICNWKHTVITIQLIKIANLVNKRCI